jgi:hypothetical protein
MKSSRFDPPRLAKALPQTWISIEEATTLLRERLGLPPFARADSQAALHTLLFHGFVERLGNQVRRAEVQPEWPPPPPPPPKPPEFIPITGNSEPEPLNIIRHIPSAPWATGITYAPVKHPESFGERH